MNNYFLNQLDEQQLEILKNGFSNMYDGAKVNIEKDNQNNFLVIIDNDLLCVLYDFDTTLKDENISIAYCTFMANIFKEDYINKSLKYWNEEKNKANKKFSTFKKNLTIKDAMKIIMLDRPDYSNNIADPNHKEIISNCKYYNTIYARLKDEYNKISAKELKCDK